MNDTQTLYFAGGSVRRRWTETDCQFLLFCAALLAPPAVATARASARREYVPVAQRRAQAAATALFGAIGGAS